MKKARILIVEDETDVLRANRLYLEQEGYEVIAAATVHDAQNAVWEQPPDLIVLDVMLPDGSGYDFCKEIRKITTAPIIFLTCMDSKENIIGGLELGADDYITKPFSLDILSARIAAQLRRGGLSRGAIVLPPLRIDLRVGKAQLYGEELGLSSKELQLLAFFAENTGREFTPEEIYRAVWDEELGASYSNTVRVHISNLRSKLRLDDAAPFEICLTPNKGYTFIKTIFE